jgi:hypothetical protein
MCTLALVFAFLPGRALAVGCPWAPDHWFNVTVKIAPGSLPIGVTAEDILENTGNSEIYFNNSTAVPLIVNLPDPKKVYLEHYPRPLTLKFVLGEVYYCDVLSIPMRCEMKGQREQLNAHVHTPEMDRAVSTGWVMNDDRPLHVKIPAPQPFTFSALYGSIAIKIVGIVYFSLNANYDPKLGIESRRLCYQESR